MPATIYATMRDIVQLLAPARAESSACVLRDVGSTLGATSPIYRYRGSMHGLTSWRQGRIRIEVMYSRSEGRRRLTWAHELGHILFDPVVATDVLSSWSPEALAAQQEVSMRFIASAISDVRRMHQAVGLERLCDLLGFELLLPVSAVRNVASQVSDIATLMTAAREWRVSLAFMVLRIRECHSRDIALVQLRRAYDGHWVVIESLGVMPGWSLGAILDTDTQAAIEDMGSDSSVRMPMTTLTRCDPVTYSVHRRKDTAIALFHDVTRPLTED